MTHISSTYEPQDVALSSVKNEREPRATLNSKENRNLFSFFHAAGWEPLCPDLLREVFVGLGRQD